MTAAPHDVVITGVGEPTRTCVQCQQTYPHDNRFFYGRFDLSLGKMRFQMRCKRCSRRFRKSRQKALATERAERLIPPPQKKKEHVFDAVLRDMELVFGPYRTWKREVHEEHTRRVQVALNKPVEPRIPKQPVALDPSHPLYVPPSRR